MREILSRNLLIAGMSLLLGVSAPAQTPLATDPYEPLQPSGKARVFGSRIISPASLGKSAFMAGINQIQDSPEEWGQGMAGYGRRYGHKIVTRGIENGIGFLASVTLGQDPRYFRSSESGFWHRSRHALLYTAMTRTDDGGRTPAFWRFAGNFGTQFVSNAWRPERHTQFSDTMVRGTVSIGYDAASNLVKEFWPDIRRKIFRRSN